MASTDPPPKGFAAELLNQAEATRSEVQSCRVWQWLHELDESDRDNLLKAFEMDLPTDHIVRFLVQKNVVPNPGPWKINDHRRNRCKCPPDRPGVLPKFRKGNG